MTPQRVPERNRGNLKAQENSVKNNRKNLGKNREAQEKGARK
jgi:hypothetical protein